MPGVKPTDLTFVNLPGKPALTPDGRFAVVARRQGRDHRSRTRLHHLGDGEQRQVALTARDIAREHLEEAGQQRGGQFRAVGFERVEHLGGDAARIVGVESPGVEHAGGQEHRGEYLDVTVVGQRLAYGAATLLARRQSPSCGSGREHRRDLFESLEAKHFLDEICGLTQVGAPRRRRHRPRIVAVASDLEAVRSSTH